MRDDGHVEIDEAAVVSLVEASKTSSPKRVAAASATVFVGTLAVIIVLPAVLGSELWPGLKPLNRRVWFGLPLALLFAGWTAFQVRRSYGRASKAEVVDRIRAEWKQLNGAGWQLRFLMVGLAMGVAVGLPVGLILAFTTPVGEVAWGNRSAAVLAFIGLTLIWTIPMAYVIRLISIRSFRPYVR